MPRSPDGSYSLPAGTLVSSGDTILVSQHNPAMQDIASALGQSLDRDGSGGMRSPLDMGGFPIINAAPGSEDRKSVVQGTSVSVRVDLGGRRIIKKTMTQSNTNDRRLSKTQSIKQQI